MQSNTTPSKLVLFDIDGTILCGGSLWKECFLSAVDHYFPEFNFPNISFNGKTDLQIAHELLASSQISEHDVQIQMRKIIDLYIEKALEQTQTRAHEVEVLPGVRELLNELDAHPDVFLGLLTGNVKKGAATKLTCVGLENYFRFGVFGDDHWDRYKLPALAQKKVKDEFKLNFTGKQIVIIGDTIHDVNCGKSIGVRSIAVGTGRNVCQNELLEQKPDFYFKDLSDTYLVLDSILKNI
jgi:phosphoglycolate phosphatase-like HAD superfamily hydrolase